MTPVTGFWPMTISVHTHRDAMPLAGTGSRSRSACEWPQNRGRAGSCEQERREEDAWNVDAPFVKKCSKNHLTAKAIQKRRHADTADRPVELLRSRPLDKDQQQDAGRPRRRVRGPLCGAGRRNVVVA